jgi:hypothetical protein
MHRDDCSSRHFDPVGGSDADPWSVDLVVEAASLFLLPVLSAPSRWCAPVENIEGKPKQVRERGC